MGSYSGVISGQGQVRKRGSGTVTLSGANSYTGGTTIFEGTLVGGVANLPGNISLDGTVAIASGGRLAPGNSIGVLTEGATSFASGATFEYEVDSTDLNDLANAADLLVVNGNLDIAAAGLAALARRRR